MSGICVVTLNIILHRYADQVEIGNEILVDENDKIIPAKVINILISKAQGKD